MDRKSSFMDRICDFVTQVEAKAIPRDALDTARLGITDFIGVTLAGSRNKLSRIIISYGKKMGGSPEATIVGEGFKTSQYLAALINGTMGHALDYDDMSVSPIVHPSVFLAPAILAVGENTSASGIDTLTAYVVGYEVAGCIGEPIFQSHYVQGWHSTATFGSLGAVAAAGWLLKLTAHQLKMAMGIAASLAGGLRQNFGTMTKPLHAGKAAANGVQAALLAQAGFTADDDIFGAPLGFAKVFGHPEEVNWEKAGEKLGRAFRITSPVGLATKPYPSCGFTHTAIDAALHIKRTYQVRADDIGHVQLGTSPFDKQILIHHRPKTGLEGKFSLEYCVARALVSGEVVLRHFTDAAVAQPAAKQLIKKMEWTEQYPMPATGTQEAFGIKSVKATLKNGTEHHKEVRIAKGMPGNPLSTDEFRAKYRDCASTVLTDVEVEKSLSALSGLQGANNLKKIMKLTTKKTQQ